MSNSYRSYSGGYNGGYQLPPMAQTERPRTVPTFFRPTISYERRLGRLVPNRRTSPQREGCFSSTFNWTPPHLSPAWGYRPYSIPTPGTNPIVPKPVIVSHKVNVNEIAKSGVAAW
eukprot:CAMPEP_0175093930 /NCGR_PEP_ID=MMETSP0086_2-20121207/3294_1 /TAXON_ID=136419 /ORGANISM="Unknown Unknown, Strain D1" /LENGTH=115 /DNA_ID=CAMNT_0016366963 /DNA_START=33 /DNA_END=377 /DNA_ORIENTATION=+